MEATPTRCTVVVPVVAPPGASVAALQEELDWHSSLFIVKEVGPSEVRLTVPGLGGEEYYGDIIGGLIRAGFEIKELPRDIPGTG
jgi:hypothetical protein